MFHVLFFISFKIATQNKATNSNVPSSMSMPVILCIIFKKWEAGNHSGSPYLTADMKNYF